MEWARGGLRKCFHPINESTYRKSWHFEFLFIKFAGDKKTFASYLHLHFMFSENESQVNPFLYYIINTVKIKLIASITAAQEQIKIGNVLLTQKKFLWKILHILENPWENLELIWNPKKKLQNRRNSSSVSHSLHFSFDFSYCVFVRSCTIFWLLLDMNVISCAWSLQIHWIKMIR